ncbi:MAG: hypothetical protein LKG14_03780 [Prevotella sp.]|nr:hypothetical protein [uncultured Prevotella sp.]MCI1246491.1 hypothetical protein [Prevotella sp.]
MKKSPKGIGTCVLWADNGMSLGLEQMLIRYSRPCLIGEAGIRHQVDFMT